MRNFLSLRVGRSFGVTAAAICASALPGCVTLDFPAASTSDAPTLPSNTGGDDRSAPLLESAQFAVWDMHGSGTQPTRSEKVIDPALAWRGYWLSSSALGMPRAKAGARMGAGKPLAEVNLTERASVLDSKLRATGISGTSAMVMLDAEAFEPWESAKALAWYDQSARIASEHFDNWFWYFQPGRMEAAVPSRFPNENAYFDWFATQEFMQLAPAISVTVYHGRPQDARNTKSAASRMRNDKHLKRAIAFARRMGKPLIVTVRADLSGKPRVTIMSKEALEASWEPLFTRRDVDGIAIWNDQPADKIDFDRQWARQRIEPVLRTLLEARAARLGG
jgi:hypothetical protein